MKVAESLVAYVPAGGEGTRLHPHSTLIQKPMMPMGPKRKLIDFAMRLAAAADRTLVATNSVEEKSRIVEDYVRRFPGTVVVRDFRKIGAASMLDHAEVFMNLEPGCDVVTLPADHVFERLSLLDMQARHKEAGADVTLLVTQPKDYGGYLVADGGWARRPLLEPEAGSYSTTGIFMITSRYLGGWLRRELSAGWNGEVRNLYQDFILPAIDTGRVGVYELPPGAYWDDAGVPERYHRNNMRLSGGSNIVSPDARVDPKASVERCVVIGSPVIERGEVVHDAIVSGTAKERYITRIP